MPQGVKRFLYIAPSAAGLRPPRRTRTTTERAALGANHKPLFRSNALPSPRSAGRCRQDDCPRARVPTTTIGPLNVRTATTEGGRSITGRLLGGIRSRPSRRVGPPTTHPRGRHHRDYPETACVWHRLRGDNTQLVRAKSKKWGVGRCRAGPSAGRGPGPRILPTRLAVGRNPRFFQGASRRWLRGIPTHHPIRMR